jgi:hypothetical protein
LRLNASNNDASPDLTDDFKESDRPHIFKLGVTWLLGDGARGTNFLKMVEGIRELLLSDGCMEGVYNFCLGNLRKVALEPSNNY